MDAKMELMTVLCGLFPGMGSAIAEALRPFSVTKGNEGQQCGITERIDAFLAAKRVDGLTVKTLKNYRDMLGAFARRVDKPVEHIALDDIRGYLCYLKDVRGLKQSSIQTHINTLRSFFSWLEGEEIICKSPMRRIKSLKFDKNEARRPLTAGELKVVRSGCTTAKETALVEFLVSSGCRLSEVVALRLDQINWTERSAVVTGKGNKTRTVYFSKSAKSALQRYIKHRKGGEALFASSYAPYQPMKAAAIERAIRRIGERAGCQRHIHPHLMRHTFATDALNRGMDITIIQNLMGHTDPKTTMIYAELRQDTVKAAYDRVVA